MGRFLLSLAGALVVPVAAPGADVTPRPNVVIVMTDDQGLGDFSFTGNPVLKTPGFDAFAKESVRLTDFHVAPMCSPTRGQLMTGLSALRNGATSVTAGRTFLRPGLPTLPEVFAKSGYRTGIFGKWHLGDVYPHRPIDKGFQESVYHLGTVQGRDFVTQVTVLAGIAVAMTIGVYGLVAAIVKLDDLGLYLSRLQGLAASIGRGILRAAPWLMKGLSVLGTAAMFLVGGGILTHGIPALHHAIENLARSAGAVGQVLLPTLLDGVAGIVAGALALVVVKLVGSLRGRPQAA